MMISTALPTQAAWLTALGSQPLPVLRHTVHELDALRANADMVNARVLAGIILRDPLMTLRVLAFIETNRRQRQTTDITTIERALMMIGIDPFFREFQHLPLVEEQLKSHPRALIGVLKVIARSRKAAHWARDWAIIRHDIDVDEITVATLLYDLPEILMWCFAPELALNALAAHNANHQRRSTDIQAEIYGISLYELKSGLATAWHMPNLLKQLLDNESANQPRLRNVKLAVDLARHSGNGWDDAAIPTDLRKIIELLRIPQESLLHKLGLHDDSDIAASLAQALTQPEQAAPPV
jgi:HD-like signal output (HDOD) protein